MTLRCAALGLSLLFLTCRDCPGMPQTSQKVSGSAAVSQGPTIRTTTSLVVVDVLAEDKRTGEPIKSLEQEDFLLRDDGKPVPITTFNSGKNQNLRPIQLWFVLACNEERHYPINSERRTQYEATETLGASFLAGKTAELLSPALKHLGAGETVGVAHWCDNGESEIDLMPTEDRRAPLTAIERIAVGKSIVIESFRGSYSRERLLPLIDDVARTAFPLPVTAVVFVGGKRPGTAKMEDNSSGFMEFWSTDFGVEEGKSSSGAGDSRYSIQNAEYGARLGTIIEILHDRYEIGFLPGRPEQKLHHVSVSLTKEAKELHPDLLLRYRHAYRDEAESGEGETAKATAEWKVLDSRLLAAVRSPSNLKQIVFGASRAAEANRRSTQFLAKIQADELTWRLLPNGDRRSLVTAVLAGYSAKGQLTGVIVMDLEIVEEFGRLPGLKDKPVVLSLNAALQKGTTRIRFVVRDVATGRIGSQDLDLGLRD